MEEYVLKAKTFAHTQQVYKMQLRIWGVSTPSAGPTESSRAPLEMPN